MRNEKGTNENPNRIEMFIATRTNQKRKAVDQETQDAIEEFQNRQAAGETEDEAFEAIVGKEQPGRQHQEEVASLKGELGDVKEEVHGLRSLVKLLLQRSEPGISPEEIEALLQTNQRPPIDEDNAGNIDGH
ncbi:hypothetical protein PIB30_061191 [Stylosanthes scabra]|uniref:Uncharacterized protein n=1 Tax=Stylosanthes scabra TaxID=79078 RepID=A0ABU6TKK9_9FABA|nr:hypothetical protein [Stylosanthes scabra]